MTETPTANPATTRDPAAVAHFIERFAQTFVDAGMPRIASRIFIALTTTDSGRLTAADLAEQLHASPAAISGGVRYLLQVNMISRGRKAGSRRDHYQVDDDVWYKVITQRDHLLGQWAADMRDGADTLGPDTPAGARYAESVEFFKFLQTEMQAIPERWEKYRTELRQPA